MLARECQPALVRETARTADGVPAALYAKMAELGWTGLIVPEAHGGLGLGTLELALVLEELGRVVAPGPFLGTQLVTAGLVRAGTAAAKKAWLPRLVAGEALGGLAYLEASDRHDPADAGSLPNNFVRDVDEDAEGNLWVATEGGGIAKWVAATDRFQSYRQRLDSNDSLASDRVRTLRDAGFRQFAVFLAAGHEDALDDWARLRDAL